MVTFLGYHAYRTYSISTTADTIRNQRILFEKRYSEFSTILQSDEWLKGLEEQIQSKKERNIQSYVRGVYTAVDKDWSGPKPNYVEGLGPII